VPAAAVTQVVQTLIGRIGCKAYVGGLGPAVLAHVKRCYRPLYEMPKVRIWKG